MLGRQVNYTDPAPVIDSVRNGIPSAPDTQLQPYGGYVDGYWDIGSKVRYYAVMFDASLSFIDPDTLKSVAKTASDKAIQHNECLIEGLCRLDATALAGRHILFGWLTDPLEFEGWAAATVTSGGVAHNYAYLRPNLTVCYPPSPSEIWSHLAWLLDDKYDISAGWRHNYTEDDPDTGLSSYIENPKEIALFSIDGSNVHRGTSAQAGAGAGGGRGRSKGKSRWSR